MSCGHPHYLPLPPVDDSSQTGRLADELAMSIHLGALSPGSPLREVEIAEANGVSRTIVRAALQRLEGQGLAEIVLNKGARVRAVAAEAVGDMIDLHVELMSLAARRAAERATPAQVTLMHQFVDMMDHVADEHGPVDEFQHLRVGFARSLFVASGPVLAERLMSAAPVIPHHAAAVADIGSPQGQAEAARLSRELLGAVVRRDPDAAALAAETLLRRHQQRAGLGVPAKPAGDRRTRAA